MTVFTLSAPSSTPSAPASAPATLGVTAGAPRRLLRLEAAAVLALALSAFARLHGDWGLFALLFLVPDLSMLGYLAGPRIGAGAYNAAHSYLGPALLGAAALVGPGPVALHLALIWAAHIGFDRMLGYGLKYDDAFKLTHLGAGAL
jgi:hypothetical protein